MDNKTKNNLAKIAIAALMLSATLPITGYAQEDDESENSTAAHQNCGAARSNGDAQPETNNEIALTLTPQQQARLQEQQRNRQQQAQLRAQQRLNQQHGMPTSPTGTR